MKWKARINKQGEYYRSKSGYRVEKETKEPCYTAIDPKGKPLPAMFYYMSDAKNACMVHEEINR